MIIACFLFVFSHQKQSEDGTPIIELSDIQ